MAKPWEERTLGRLRALGPESLLRRIRDIVERGRIDVAQIKVGNLVGWLLARSRAAEAPPTLGEVCVVLEGAARLVLLKARRLAGSWEPAPEEIVEPWGGPPAGLPLRRSWLAERVAAGPLSHGAPLRAHEDAEPLLAPIAPTRLRVAMLAVLLRAKAVRPKVVALPRLVRASVEACCSLILERVGRGHELNLSEFVGEGRDAQVAAFLACLTLARQGRVELEQNALFDDILVRPTNQAFEATA